MRVLWPARLGGIRLADFWERRLRAWKPFRSISIAAVKGEFEDGWVDDPDEVLSNLAEYWSGVFGHEAPMDTLIETQEEPFKSAM